MKKNEERCYLGGKLHNLQPRNTVTETHKHEYEGRIKEDSKKCEYLYDICVWCGKIFK